MAKQPKKPAVKVKRGSTRAGAKSTRGRTLSASTASNNGHVFAAASQLSPATAASSPLSEMSMRGFVKELRSIDEHQASQSFVFLLGAGASVSSGIPGAQKLAQRWLDELQVQDTRYGGVPFHQWMHDARHEIENLDPKNVAASYPDIFDRRFASNPNHGYAVLTSLMKDAQPGYGYSVLATMLSRSRHKAVITTNFDSLVERALLYYTNDTPLTCTHETTAGGFRKTLARPLIVKCHRDLLLDPHNGRQQVSKLHDNYGKALASLLPGKVLIVVGYGGNDGSLMGFLSGLDPEHSPEAVYWCYWEQGGLPDASVCNWVAKNRGRLVPIPGFDELMAGISGEFAYPLLDADMEAQHKERVRRYREQVEQIVRKSPATDVASAKRVTAGSATTEGASGSAPADITERSANTPSASDAVNFASESIGKAATAGTRPQSAWESLLRIHSLSDIADKDAAFRKALAEFPNSAIIIDNYASFLWDTFGRREEAEGLYTRALEAEPENAHFLNDYAFFLQDISGRRAEAEALYKRAIKADPENARILGNYAYFLQDTPGRRDELDTLYKRALAAGPNDACNLNNYAYFLQDVPGRREEAEAFYKRALDADQDNARILANYAYFLGDTPGRRDEAEALLKRALKASPNDARIIGCYATFLQDMPGRREEAEALLVRAVEANPKNANAMVNYARFLIAIGRIADAEITLDRAIQALLPTDHWAVFAKCWMCAYCIRPADQQAPALARLKAGVLADRVRASDVDFSRVISQVTELGHPEATWLPKLADVLMGKADRASLDPWPAWRTAS